MWFTCRGDALTVAEAGVDDILGRAVTSRHNIIKWSSEVLRVAFEITLASNSLS